MYTCVEFGRLGCTSFNRDRRNGYWNTMLVQAACMLTLHEQRMRGVRECMDHDVRLYAPILDGYLQV